MLAGVEVLDVLIVFELAMLEVFDKLVGLVEFVELDWFDEDSDDDDELL